MYYFYFAQIRWAHGHHALLWVIFGLMTSFAAFQAGKIIQRDSREETHWEAVLSWNPRKKLRRKTWVDDVAYACILMASIPLVLIALSF